MLLLAIVLLVSVGAFNQTAGSDAGTPHYTAKDEPKLPEQYREWVYLSTGMDMSYTAGGNTSHHMFDDVFVNPASFKKFQEAGTWPDKTMLAWRRENLDQPARELSKRWGHGYYGY